MWTFEKDGHRNAMGAHIDDFLIYCEDRSLLDEFRTRLLEAFEGTYEGAAHHYLGCHIDRNIQQTFIGRTSPHLLIWVGPGVIWPFAVLMLIRSKTTTTNSLLSHVRSLARLARSSSL